MLVDIIRMPPAFGVPLDRRITICADPQVPQGILEPVVHWPLVPLVHKRLMVGSLVDIQPQNLYKAIHISDDSQWVFETVFAVEDADRVHCLYTKMISSQSVSIAVSVAACREYQSTRNHLMSLSNFVTSWDSSFDGRYEGALTIGNKPSNFVVPPVFGQRSLWGHIHRLLDMQNATSPEPPAELAYKPLYYHAPMLLEALVDGKFYRSPFYEVAGRYPGVEIVRDKWFDYENISYQAHHRGYETCCINHPEFDSIALALLSMNPAKFTVSALISHAIDWLPALWLTRAYYDPYQSVLYGMGFNDKKYAESLTQILSLAVMTYCRLHGIDYNLFMVDPEDRSSVTISKNIYDEVVITFHDMKTDRYEAYYSSFPTLALATLSVGWYR